MASLAEQMIKAGEEKAKARKSEEADRMEPSCQPCYVNVEKAVNGYTIRFGGGPMGWNAGIAVAKDASEIGEAIVKFLEKNEK